MTDQPNIQITVDGFPEEVGAGTTLAALLHARGEPAKVVMVEHNGAYVPSTELNDVSLAPGDRVELILPAFGG